MYKKLHYLLFKICSERIIYKFREIVRKESYNLHSIFMHNQLKLPLGIGYSVSFSSLTIRPRNSGMIRWSSILTYFLDCKQKRSNQIHRMVSSPIKPGQKDIILLAHGQAPVMFAMWVRMWMVFQYHAPPLPSPLMSIVWTKIRNRLAISQGNYKLIANIVATTSNFIQNSTLTTKRKQQSVVHDSPKVLQNIAEVGEWNAAVGQPFSPLWHPLSWNWKINIKKV